MKEKILEKKAIATYQQNMLYFQKNHTNIYEKLLAFDEAIENQHYQNRYDLIFKESYFDVLEIQTNKYLYNTNSLDYASMVANSISFDKKSNLYETFKKINFKTENITQYEEINFIENALTGLVPILDYTNQHSLKNSELKSIDKFIFFGVGLGQHLLSIDTKIRAKMYFIVEDDLELFKLSLFTTPYYKLAQNAKLVFSVFESKEEFSNTASIFLEPLFYYNHYIKYFQMLSHSDEKLEEFHVKIASQSHNLFFYNVILEQYLRPLTYMQENFHFLNIATPYLATSLQSKPVLYLAAGPSLHHNLSWIQENQDKFFIIALSATLSILEKHSIKPTIITHMDGFDDAAEHFTKIHKFSFFENTIFLISARTPAKIMQLLTKENVFLFENGTSYKQNLGNLSAPCVGSTTYLLLLALGVENMYLLGLDLALDNETGTTHAQGHFQKKNLNTSMQEHQDTISFKEHVMYVQGNLRQSVATLPDWKLSIESINQTSLGFKKESQHVYNLSDGASFKNTYTQEIQQLDISLFTPINKESLFEEVKILFTKNSSSIIEKNELALLKRREKHAKKMKNFLKAQEKKNFSSHEDFLKSLTLLSKNLTQETSSSAYDLSLIYQEYFRMIYSFIFDFFNVNDMQNTALHSHEINKRLTQQLFKIVDIYIDGLKVGD